MGFKRFWRRLFGKQGTSDRRREAIASIEAMGFKLLDLRGWHEGKHAPRRYHLVDGRGNVLDNNGDGYHSTSSARKAAEKALATRN